GAATSAAALPALDACSDTGALRAAVSPPLTTAARKPVDGSPAADGGESPDFRLPFACGESWRLSVTADLHVELVVPGGDSSAGFAVFASTPGWVLRIDADH